MVRELALAFSAFALGCVASGCGSARSTTAEGTTTSARAVVTITNASGQIQKVPLQLHNAPGAKPTRQTMYDSGYYGCRDNALIREERRTASRRVFLGLLENEVAAFIARPGTRDFRQALRGCIDGVWPKRLGTKPYRRRPHGQPA